MIALVPLVLACSAIASLYQLLQIVAARRFLLRSRRLPTGYTPPITVLKPLKGPGVELATNL